MSHLLDSGLAQLDTRLDITDTYLFRGQVGTVFVMCVNSSAAGVDREPGFHPNARYDFRVDVNGDAREEMTLRVTFGPRSAIDRQPFEVRLLDGREQFDCSAAGTLLTWGSTENALEGRSGLRVWAGLVVELFHIDPAVLQAIRRAFQLGCKVEVTSDLRGVQVDPFVDASVHAIVLEIPDEMLLERLDGRNRIGFWATTTLATDAGGWRPINRMGLPMVQSIFNPPDDERASDYNTTHPSADLENYGDLFAHLIARVVDAHGTAENPNAYGVDVARLILPDMLPYRVGGAANFGFAALNGRSLTDNAPEVMFSIVTNFALACSIAERPVASLPTAEFPYLPRWPR